LSIGLPVVFLMASVLFFLAPSLIALFNQDPEVVRYGTLFMRLNVYFRLFMCVIQILAGTMRGAGCAKTPMYIFMFSYIVFRQIYLFIMSQIAYNPYTMGFGYAAGWIMAAVLLIPAYKFSGWEKKALKTK